MTNQRFISVLFFIEKGFPLPTPQAKELFPYFGKLNAASWQPLPTFQANLLATNPGDMVQVHKAATLNILKPGVIQSLEHLAQGTAVPQGSSPTAAI